MTNRVISLTRYRMLRETTAARKEIWAAAEVGDDQRFEAAKAAYAEALRTFERLSPTLSEPVIESPGRVGARVQGLVL